MSRIGLKKIPIPPNVKIEWEDRLLRLCGPKGSLSRSIRPELTVTAQEGMIYVTRISDDPNVRALHGLTRNEIYNMIRGITEGYERVLELHGVGYRAALEASHVIFSIGRSHPVRFALPAGVTAVIDKQTVITLKGMDRHQVGQVAADMRALRPPEPYKGKGIRYREEHVRRKEGKAGKGAK